MPQFEPRDLNKLQEQFHHWLLSKLPNVKDLKVTIHGAPEGTGASNETWLIDADWTDGKEKHLKKLVVRVQPIGFCVFPSYDVGMQFRIMKELKSKTDVPVPHMRWHEPDASFLGSPFIVMDKLEGRVPNDFPPYYTGGWISEITPEERSKIWWNGLEAMSRVHKLDYKSLNVDLPWAPKSGSTPLQQQLKYWDNYFTWGMERSRYPLIESASKWLQENQPVDEPLGIVWGDSRLANQMFDADLRSIAVIDWEMAHVGNPVQDLAWWTIYDRTASEGWEIDKLPGFGERDETVARWEELVGRKAKDLKYYEILSLYWFALVMARVVLRGKHYGTFQENDQMDITNQASNILEKVLKEVL